MEQTDDTHTRGEVTGSEPVARVEELATEER